MFQLQHGEWEQDYFNDLTSLDNPDAGRYIAVGEIDGTLAGFISWRVKENRNHGQIYLLAVAKPYRRQKLGYELCAHAVDHMRSIGVEIVEIGTGDDEFHAAARGLYEGLGFTKIPIAGYLKKI